jgi:hypothetical protein
MGSLVTAADLTVVVSESVDLNGVNRNSKHVSTISSIGEVFNRIMSVPTTGIDLSQFASAEGAGTFSTGASGAGTVEYMRFTNLDDTNFVTITCSDDISAGSSGHLFCIKLAAGKSFILGSVAFNAEDDGDADNALGADDTIANIRAVANTASVDMEIYIASQ